MENFVKSIRSLRHLTSFIISTFVRVLEEEFVIVEVASALQLVPTQTLRPLLFLKRLPVDYFMFCLWKSCGFYSSSRKLWSMAFVSDIMWNGLRSRLLPVNGPLCLPHLSCGMLCRDLLGKLINSVLKDSWRLTFLKRHFALLTCRL